ncbi:MAG: three-Cys-motif partner protein TcmP, partial [Nitrospira sp.]|nr:three-Cys-motif partner protein TcmP [Nitrospira sp.]
MPSKKFDTTWKADPHTIAKITILEAYLHAWFQIMGRSMAGQDIVYIDGFSGPGEYTNHPKGSPIAALEAAKASLTHVGRHWKAGDIHCAFIESDEKRFSHLKQVIANIEGHQRINVHLIPTTFTEGLIRIKAELACALRAACPLFVFIDPFGATGVPFSAVEDILKSSCSEVLLNFDADGIARIYAAAERAGSDTLLTEIFGDEGWKSAL